ncbi:MAG TPA: hypothetical protein VGT61_10040 [Thermomicrobiales bacterium]|jgi:hypothetical protein|nr:hypothetical protein [Thermomicrobiales bacterium]
MRPRHLPHAVRVALVVLVLLAAYLGPRLTSLDRMIQTDEADWLGGAANVYTGVAHGNLTMTYQLPHPGATTLLAGVLAYVVRIPDYPALHADPVPFHRVDVVLRDLGHDPMMLLVTARTVKLLMQAALLLVAAWLMWRLFGWAVAATTSGLICFEPFLIGYDRMLHIDGLVTVASFAAVLAIAAAGWARDRPARWWALAGALSALAWMSRFTAGVLGVVAVAVIIGPPLVAVLRRRTTVRAAARSAVRPLAAWLAASAVTTLALLPALIVAPVATLGNFWDYVANAASAGHELPTFYAGQVHMGDPGWTFYPDAILWRMTPVVLIGLFVLLGGAIVRPRTFLPVGFRAPLLIVASFLLLYGGLMTAGAKKFDRYILPVFPPLDLLAAIGWIGLVRLLWEVRPHSREVLATTAVTVLLVAQGGAAWSDRAYGLDYYNPIRGGISAAETGLQIGAGEGLDQAAAFIVAQPGGTHATVRSQNNNVTMLYLMPETVTVLNSELDGGPTGIDQWATTDYYVSYLPQWIRDLNPVMQHQASRYEPVHTARVDGVAFAHVYDLRAIPPPPELVDGLTCRWNFGDDATLLTYRDQSIRVDGDSPNQRRLDLYVQTGPNFGGAHAVEVQLVPREDGLEPIALQTTLVPAPAPGAISTASVDYQLPHGRTTGSYDVVVTVREPATGESIPARLSGQEDSPGPHAIINACDGAGQVD